MLRSFLFLLIIPLFTYCNKPLSKSETATQINFNQGWEFVEGIDPGVSAEQLSTDGNPSISWQPIALPHTAKLEPLVISGDQWQGTSFYRKSFQVPESDRGRHLALKFEAAMQVAEVYLNGKAVFRHLGGYLPFYVDISDEVKYGQENVVLVKLNNEDNAAVPPGKPIRDLDFNYFSGIYRNVYLISKA